jgi:hypothetical protein
MDLIREVLLTVDAEQGGDRNGAIGCRHARILLSERYLDALPVNVTASVHVFGLTWRVVKRNLPRWAAKPARTF